MKRKMMYVLCSVLLCMTLLAGCAQESAKADAETGEGGGTKATYKVAMILDSTISDGGWGAACYNAMVNAADMSGFETQYTDGLNSADFATTMRSYADLGIDLIFAPGNQYSDAVREVAGDYPEVKFALLNGTIESDNIVSLLPDATQIGYMAGALAGLISETNRIGFVGGMELDTTKAKLASYEEAAKKVNPDIQVFSAYAGSFSDTAKGKEIAETMISMNNVDVMFGDASAVDSGVREVLASEQKRYDIAQPSDLLSIQESDVVVSSVVTDNATMIQICMEDVKKDTYGNKTIYGNLENGSLSVGTFGDQISDEVKEDYLSIVEEIKEGTFIEE